ncbi:MAG TPA: hypothetical protein VEX63_09855 [Flavisolibacter sp.]|nr:hypothetical protein [Flavisolibacter sp.]
MAKQTHKGSEFNNVNETWDENERRRESGSAPMENVSSDEVIPASELERMISDEAAEYDQANKEDRILGGDRATVNDDEDA